MSNFKLIALCILLVSCSNVDESTNHESNPESQPANQNTIVNPNKTSKVQVVKAEGTANNLQNEQEDSVEDLYAQLPPRERSIRELSANSACKDFNKYLVIQSEIVSHTDEKITYKITATNHSPFPIQQARGALQIIDTVNNRYICDYVAWGFEKEDGSNINPGENINKIYETGKRHRCDSDFIKNPNNGYLLHYSQGSFMLPDGSELTSPTAVNCTYLE